MGIIRPDCGADAAGAGMGRGRRMWIDRYFPHSNAHTLRLPGVISFLPAALVQTRG
jgi:hypothetical protein